MRGVWSKEPGRRFLRFGAVALLAVFLIVTTQGCCSWCRNNCAQPEVVVIALAIGVDDGSCPSADCVCSVPKVTHVNPGDIVRFVNASPHKVIVSRGDTFVGVSSIELAPGESKSATFRGDLPDGSFSLNLEVDSPGYGCVGYPGPRVVIP